MSLDSNKEKWITLTNLADLDCARAEYVFRCVDADVVHVAPGPAVVEIDAARNELDELKQYAGITDDRKVIIMNGYYEIVNINGVLYGQSLYEHLTPRYQLIRVCWFHGEPKIKPVKESAQIEAFVGENEHRGNTFWINRMLTLESGNRVTWAHSNCWMIGSFKDKKLQRGFHTELNPTLPTPTSIIFVVHGKLQHLVCLKISTSKARKYITNT